MAKNSRPFFTCNQPREGIEGKLPDTGCGLPSPNRSPSIGINKRNKTISNEEGNRWLAAVRLNGSTPYQPAQEN